MTSMLFMFLFAVSDKKDQGQDQGVIILRGTSVLQQATVAAAAAAN